MGLEPGGPDPGGPDPGGPKSGGHLSAFYSTHKCHNTSQVRGAVVSRHSGQSGTTWLGGRKVGKEEEKWDVSHFYRPEPRPTAPAAYV